MIPKTINYCWFGNNKKSSLAKKCIDSWYKKCPDFEIVEWNEDNFDVNCTAYTSWCYKNKKWAFLSDYARLKIIYDNGGVYFDTDVEVLRDIEPLLHNAAFFAFENAESIATGLGFGALPEHMSVKAMIDEYDALTPADDGSFLPQACPALNTRALLQFGLKADGTKQCLGDILILSSEYMNPYDDPTGRMLKTKNTYSVHWYAKSWLSRGAVLQSNLTRPIHRIFGKDCFRRKKS